MEPASIVGMRKQWLLVAAMCGVAGCDGGGANDAPGVAGVDEGKSDTPVVGDTGTNLVELKDDTSTFATDKPSGGWWVTPIHATLLNDGKVVVTGWGRRDKTQCGFHGTRKNGETFLLDPGQVAQGGTFFVTPINEQGEKADDVLYCAGHVPLGDGRVFYTGGATYVNLGDPNQLEFGVDYARIFDPSTKSFQRLSQKLDGGPAGQEGLHWYPTNTRLDDGRVLTTAGFAQCCDGKYANLSVHKFDVGKLNAGQNPWSLLVSQAHGDGEISPGLRDYTHTFLLPKKVNQNGREYDLVMSGWMGKMVLFSSADGIGESDRFNAKPNAQRHFNGQGWNSAAALVSTGEILTVGGGDKNAAKRADLYNVQTDSWWGIDTGIGRHNPSTILLPDGNVLVVSGENDAQGFDGDSRAPSLIDPVARTSKTLGLWPNDNLERGYHNLALLLKDGRVLVGGGTSSQGGIGCERPDLRIYNPPYFSNGTRPTIDGTSEPIALSRGGASVTLGLKNGPLKDKGGVVLMAMGSFTHSFDQNQRYVPLAFTQTGAQVKLTPPADGRTAPPGDYILYFVGKNGAVSVGKHVHLD